MPYPIPGHYNGDAQFAEFLAEIRCPTSLFQIKAFVLGCLAATDVPKMDAIFSALWGGEAPAFDGMEQMERFAAEFFGLWNDLAGRADRLGFPLSAWTGIQSAGDLTRHTTVRQAEVNAFLSGLEAGHTDPERLGEDARRACEALVTAMHFWSEFTRLTQERPEESASELRKTEASLRQLDQVVGDAISTVMAEQRRSRMQQAQRGMGGGTYRRAPGPGRNDPCPCGSGRKYKQCCGKH